MSLSESQISHSTGPEPLSDSVVNQFESLAASEADGAPSNSDVILPAALPTSFTISTPGHNLIVTPSTFVPAVMSQGAAAVQAIAALAATTGATSCVKPEPNISPEDAALLSHAFLALKGWLVSPSVVGMTSESLAQAGGLIAAWAERPSTRRALWRGSVAALAGYCTGTAVGHVGRAATVWLGSVLVTTAILARLGYVEGFHAQKLVADISHAALWGVGSLINLAAGPAHGVLVHLQGGPLGSSPSSGSSCGGALSSSAGGSAPSADGSLAPVASAAVGGLEEASDGESKAGSDAESDGVSSLECSLVGDSLSGSYESVAQIPLGGSISGSRQPSLAGSSSISAELVTPSCLASVSATPPAHDDSPRIRVNYGAIIRSVSVVFARDPPVVVGFSSGFLTGLLMG